MIVVKKVVKILLFILCVVLGIFIYTVTKTSEIIIKNRELTEQIEKLRKENDELANKNQDIETEINLIKEKQKDKITELSIWMKAKEKLEKAMS